MEIDKIKQNHERFVKMESAIQKLRITAENVCIQYRAATKAMNEFKEIARAYGYKLNQETGQISEIANNNKKA